MLGAVSWLIELLSYDDVVAASEEDNNNIGVEAGEQADKRFFRFLSASYTAFLSGEDEEFEKLSAEMEEYFNARNKVISEEAQAAEAKALMLQEELKSLTEAESMIPSLKQDVHVLESDITKHKSYMAELEVKCFEFFWRRTHGDVSMCVCPCVRACVHVWCLRSIVRPTLVRPFILLFVCSLTAVYLSAHIW